MAFTLDSGDMERVLRTVVQSVRVPSGLGDWEDLQAEAYVHLWRNGVPALARVRRTDPLRYLRRMTTTFYRGRGRAGARARRHLQAADTLADVRRLRRSRTPA